MVDQHLNEFPAEGRKPYPGHPYPVAPRRALPGWQTTLRPIALFGFALLVVSAVLIIVAVTR